MQFDLGHINKLAVVHIVLTAKQPVYHVLILKRVKGEIAFLKMQENLQDQDELFKMLVKKYPVALHFTGKGVLNRKGLKQSNYRATMLLNANLSDFHFSDYLEDKTAFSSIIRKEVVAEFLTAFETQKLQVVSISSGPFHSAILQFALRNSKVNELSVGETLLQFENNKLVGFEKQATPKMGTVLLGDQRISQHLLPCAAVGAGFFNPLEKVIYPEEEEVFANNLEEAKQKNVFERFGMGMMLFFLVVLFSNTMYLRHLNQQMIENSVYLSAYDEQLNQIADLEDEKKRKELLLQSSGLLNKNFLSFYLMEIANSVPQQIVFDAIELRPLTEEIKQRQKIAFEEHLITVEGRAESSHVLSTWIEEIEAENWLEKVDIIQYEYVKKEGVFELEMMVY